MSFLLSGSGISGQTEEVDVVNKNILMVGILSIII